jgi:hypothetical protein
LLVAAALIAPPASACAQEVRQARGVDPQVRYDSLRAIGPWDDRNYLLTADDLAVLAPNEAELQGPLPAFFRVLLRKGNPDMPREGAAQYPRSALQIFLQQCGGYLVDGKLYQSVRLENGRYEVVLENGIDYHPPEGPPTTLAEAC